jgi:hypothetical protein
MTAVATARVQDVGQDLELELMLHVRDVDVRAELEQYPDGRPRHDYALGALKVGVLALRHAQGRVDVDRIKAEGDRLLTDLRDGLAAHQVTTTRQVAAILTEYFDPRSGRLQERIERLMKSDGELERLIRRHVGGDDSVLVRTLTTHVGEHSPLMKLLDPKSSDGFARSLTSSVEQQLNQQRETILREFSLDNRNGALVRFLEEVTTAHGEVGKALEARVSQVVAEFSLDREDSALSRLVSRVERAQRQITAEFSLDQEDSALARLRREMLELAAAQRESSELFQRDVLTKLAEITAKREEAQRSVRHGDTFECAVFDVVTARSQRAGDVATRTGATTGLIRQCKRGDIVVELGAEHTAAGAKIVVEAKEDAAYTLKEGLGDLELARKNRGADVGLFVFSARTAPAGLEVFGRYGDDIVIVWDAADPRSDITIAAAISVAKALCARARTARAAEETDFEGIDRSILEIGRQIGGLDDITKHAGTIKAGSEKIIERTRIMRDSINKHLAELGVRISDLRNGDGEVVERQR